MPLCVPLIFIFIPFNVQKLNYMGVGLMVLKNMFPPSQMQKRQKQNH